MPERDRRYSIDGPKSKNIYKGKESRPIRKHKGGIFEYPGKF